MNKVLETTRSVVDTSKTVSINKTALLEYSEEFHHKATRHWLSASPFNFSHFNEEQTLNFVLLFNAISFSYWGEPKWTIEVDNKKFDGAWGMIVALGKAIDNGFPLLKFDYLATIDLETLARILFGNTRIPLMKERVKILNEIGNVVCSKYEGRFNNLLKLANGDCMRLLSIITKEFPSFEDISELEGKEVFFYKRAQLFINDIYQIFNGKGFGELKNIDQLTACADYKLPQILRKKGILKYSTELSDKIDNKIEIPHNSREEIEIRANTIWAVEYIKTEVLKNDPRILSTEINDHLWLSTQEKFPDDKPYHRTRTTAY
jgi:hypothetical protein